MWVLKVTRFASRVSYLFFPFYLDCSKDLASLLLKQPGKVIDFPRSWRSRAPDYSVAFPIQLTEPLEGHICARWHETVQEEEVCHVAIAHDSEPSCLLGRVRGQITEKSCELHSGWWCIPWVAALGRQRHMELLWFQNQPSLCTKFQPARAVEGVPVSQRRKRAVFFCKPIKSIFRGTLPLSTREWPKNSPGGL